MKVPRVVVHSGQVGLCEAWHREFRSSPDESCAETVVKIRYLETKKVQAGFSALDTVSDVLAFARTLYSPDV